MNKLSKRILIAAVAMLPFGMWAQGERRTLTLAEVIEMAQTESPDAVSARNTYKSAYWTYRNYRANNLPELSLESNPYLNRTTDYVTSADGSVSYVRQNNVKTDLSLNVTQNMWFTGGTFQLSSTARRLDLLGTK
ncbi:MAG: TolC family protein, partial [Bacteroidaceae bacterium]|nr:TolC family protein [Bacteroidaceae bacterium]